MRPMINRTALMLQCVEDLALPVRGLDRNALDAITK